MRLTDPAGGHPWPRAKSEPDVLVWVARDGISGSILMSIEEDRSIAKAKECERKAKEALDLSVKRYFAKLARDYRNLAFLLRLRSLAPRR